MLSEFGLELRLGGRLLGIGRPQRKEEGRRLGCKEDGTAQGIGGDGLEVARGDGGAVAEDHVAIGGRGQPGAVVAVAPAITIGQAMTIEAQHVVLYRDFARP